VPWVSFFLSFFPFCFFCFFVFFFFFFLPYSVNSNSEPLIFFKRKKKKEIKEIKPLIFKQLFSFSFPTFSEQPNRAKRKNKNRLNHDQ
jgi:hypothetical protein